MKCCLFTAIATTFLLVSGGCVVVTGDFDEELLGNADDESGFHDLRQALEGCLNDPDYSLDLVVSPWRTKADWTVRYREAGSDGHAAFRKAKDAVLARIEREGGNVTEQREEGPHAWSCAFRLEDEPGKASVRLVENASEEVERPHRLEVLWEEVD